MKSILLSVLMVVLTVGAIHAQSKNTPTLAETLQWMQNTLDAGGGLLFYSLQDASIEKRSLTLPSAASCEVRFEYQTGIPGVGGGFQKVNYLATYTLNLKDIDPTNIAVFPTGSDTLGSVSTVMASTRNDANLIALRLPLGVPKQDIIPIPSNALVFTLATPYATRFAKAFTLAVEMCGGKASFFEDSGPRDQDQRAPRASAVGAAQSAPPRKDIPAIAKAADGAIVSIVMSEKDGRPIAQGSGFLISDDGVILTNYHVIAEGSSAVVKRPDGAIYVVDGVLAADKTRDVAIIKAHGKDFRTITLGDSDQVQVGEEVVAIGNPLSLESTVSNGIVSGIRTVPERGGKFLQITAPISPGSSGGPLFNMAGEVVGITTLYLEGGENLNFAIPINDAKRMLLDKSTTIQALPNEPEPVNAETHEGNTPSSVAPPSVQNAPVEHAATAEQCEADARVWSNHTGVDNNLSYMVIRARLQEMADCSVVGARDELTVRKNVLYAGMESRYEIDEISRLASYIARHDEHSQIMSEDVPFLAITQDAPELAPAPKQCTADALLWTQQNQAGLSARLSANELNARAAEMAKCAGGIHGTDLLAAATFSAYLSTEIVYDAVEAERLRAYILRHNESSQFNSEDAAGVR